MSRAQIAIELFFQIAVFFLVLTWFANYATSLHDSSTTIYAQEKAVATTIANIANQACASGTRITFTLPCIPNGNAFFAYEAYNYSSNSNALRLRIPETNYFAETNMACNVSGRIAAGCGTIMCASKQGSLASIRNGAC